MDAHVHDSRGPAEPLSGLLRVYDALGLILGEVAPLAPGTTPLADSVGLVLAQDLVSPQAHPPFDNSAMDGYAVRCADLPGPLEVVEDINAGQVPEKALHPGQASRIATGAMLPEGADAVAMVEDTELHEGRVTVRSALKPKDNLRFAGEHLQAGQAVVQAGTPLGPAELAMAAYLGMPGLECHPRPRVALLTSGDELIEPGRPLGPGQIYNSNLYALQAQVRSAGCEPVVLGTLPDDPAAIREALERAGEVDAYVTSAGVSMGPKDYVLQVLQEMGGELRLWKIAMRPGKPLGFGRLRGKPFLALPGNPVSTMVTFEVFVRPTLARLAGWRDWQPPVLEAVLEEPVSKKLPLRFFHRCLLRREGDTIYARLTGAQGSHILLSLAQARGLLELDEETSHWDTGSRVKVRLLWNQSLETRV